VLKESITVLCCQSGGIVVAATGPSITQEQCDAVVAAGLPVMAVSDAYRLLPQANYLYSCDPQWWDKHWDKVKLHPATKYTQSDEAAAKYTDLLRITGDHKPGFSTKQNLIHFGNNSGFQAMNLAYLMGYRRMLLLGFDMGPGAKGESHFFGDHPPGLCRASNHQSFISEFRKINCEKLGLTIINASPRSYLDCFTKLPLEKALDRIKES
jgi:hypothetical protein